MARRLTRVLKWCVIAGVVGFALLQIAPVKRLGIPTQDIGTNPPERFKFDGPPEVEAVMRRACFDCHTNETRWPLYARIAPGSWLLARDVHHGRSHLNFSKWGDADEDERQTDRENAWEQVESGAMPPWFYVLPMHPDAKLSEADKATLKSYFLAKSTKDKPTTDKPTTDKPTTDKPTTDKPTTDK
jgi:Haem-binding domain